MSDSPAKKFRVLLVDDDTMTRQFMYARLARQGYDVTVAEHGPAALAALDERSFDLVLLDIMMPGMSGIEVLTEIRRRYSMLNLPIIMVTANDLEETLIEALEKGANDYLLKPISLPVTLARIKAQLSLKFLSALKDEFVRFASHDLKKPLMLLRDVTDELSRCVQAPADAPKCDLAELTGMLVNTTDSMQGVIEGFLQASSTQIDGVHARRSLVDMNQVVMKTIQYNEHYAQRKGIRLTAALSDEPLMVFGDTFQISQVVDNLVGNAIKFSASGNDTVVSTAVLDGHVIVEVSDTGPGIKPDEMGKLFVKGAQLSNAPTGNETSSGVGLALCKQLVELHSGEIGARNNATRGTTFWFRIPRHATPTRGNVSQSTG
jgi:signal transduction histidine kinase